MFHPMLALGGPEIIGVIVILGVLLFGAEKLPKLARSAGTAKKEFLIGQAEADEAAAAAREEARMRARTAQADPMSNVTETSVNGENVPPPTPGKGTLSS
ncbi:MAG TPA: twin-arginine translocase TatA/TatE family subunit [Vicinamibacterales bacterium]|jgi:sec-independent protein translocase protein TatA|nr:twin-arginine translocase TatA/TatE family subunit [Vicinamibacterales bacterium]